MPPPSSGGTALIEMLNLLEGFDMAGMRHNSVAYVHHLAEAMRRAYRDRARYLADQDFVDVPVHRLTSEEYARKLRRTGFLLNNEMGDFNARPALTDESGLIGTTPNLARPGQRMLSSMTPTILARGGRLVSVFGRPRRSGDHQRRAADRHEPRWTSA